MSEKNYYASKLLQVKDNMGKAWKILNSMTNRNGNKKCIERIEKGSISVSDPSAIAEEFNNFFTNLGPDLAKQIQPSASNPLEFLKDTYSNSMFFQPTTAEEISDIISSLKNSSSAGHDNIPTKLIKICSNELVGVLAHINNESLVEGVFPDSLKIARVIPIHKNGDTKLVSNYRPISLLSAFSKIAEKIVYTRLEKYLSAHSILHKNQFGFRSKHSTCMALLELIDKLSVSIDSRDVTVGVFIDLAKAFDTVDHRILLAKLQHYGIRGSVHRWFQSYLSNREQYVTIDNHSSAMAEITCGVPQGSVLGPILFLLFINDLNYVSKLLRIIMFADDTNLFLTGKSLTQIEKDLNDELIIVTEWFKANLLSLNLSKTSYIIFGNKTHQDINICMHGFSLSRQYETKFLGVIITAKLKWTKHIDVVLSKISKCLGIISKTRHLLPLHLNRALYSTLVEPYINYCNLVWCKSKKTNMLEKIFKTQKRYCRLMTFSNFSAPSKPLFLQLKLLNVYNIYKLQLAVYMYKIYSNQMPHLEHHSFKAGTSFHNYHQIQE